jgi:hypothetical protein
VTAANLPALPDGIGPDEPVVSFHAISCRECPEHSEWFRDDHDERGEPYDWQHAHASRAGHPTFYRWTLSRNTGKTFSL